MTHPDLEKQLLTLETQYWQALKDKDYAAAIRLTDDPCIVAGAQGVASFGRAQFEDMLDAPNFTLDEFELSDAQVRMLGTDVAILAYKVKEEVTLDGEELSLEAADASTWVRRGGTWLCALHTESILGDPFGRDRTGKSMASAE
jgi:ketosteroid isomerase-like protein